MSRTKFKHTWADDPRLWPPQIHERIDQLEELLAADEERLANADADFWKLLALLDPGLYNEVQIDRRVALAMIPFDHHQSRESSRKSVLNAIKARQEREKFDAMKQADKIEYLFEKASKS